MQFWAKTWHLCHTCCSTGIPKSGYLRTGCKSATVSFQRTAVGDLMGGKLNISCFVPSQSSLTQFTWISSPEQWETELGRNRHTKSETKCISKLKAKEVLRKNLKPFRKWSHGLGVTGFLGQRWSSTGLWFKRTSEKTCDGLKTYGKGFMKRMASTGRSR